MKKLWLGIGLAFLVLFATPLMADSWFPPDVKSYASANGNWKLTIYPRDLIGPLDYFQDKVDGNAHAGGVPGDPQKSPIGHMETKQGGRWRTVWKAPLPNDVAPVIAVVSNAGAAVTLDNWHSVGWGDDAVVIYAADGRRVREFGLSAFLPRHYVDALPRSVSSLDWRGEPRIDESRRQLVIPVVVPTVEQQETYSDKHRYVDVRFQLTDGTLVPMAGPAWAEATASARKADARRKAHLAEQRQRFLSPLTAPRTDDIRAWHQYLVDAFYRLDPVDGYPATKVVPPRSDRRFAPLAKYVGDALSNQDQAKGVLMIASPSQDVLVEVVQQQAKRAKPGSLADARIYVAADQAHMPALRAALARTGAKVIQINIDAGIPQRKDRVERFLREQDGAGD